MLSIYLHECIVARVPTFILKNIMRMEIDHNHRGSFCNHFSVSMSYWWWWVLATQDNLVFCGQCCVLFHYLPSKSESLWFLFSFFAYLWVSTRMLNSNIENRHPYLCLTLSEKHKTSDQLLFIKQASVQVSTW